MMYTEEIQIENRDYILEFREQPNSDYELIVITKDGEICDSWSESYIEDLRIISQRACDWILTNKPSKICVISKSIEAFDLYKSYYSQISEMYLCNHKSFRFPIEYNASFYDRI